MRPCMLAMALLTCLARGEDEKAEPPPPQKRRFQIEILYTIHARVDTDQKLERIRKLVEKAYPDAEFKEVTVADRRTYYGTYRDRLLQHVGVTDPRHGYELVKDQVAREVALRSIYDFLLAQAKDDRSLKEIFDKLKARDDPKDPVCSTEPGKGLVVYRDFGGKALSADELTEIEDGDVGFGWSFRPRVVALSDGALPKLGAKADTLGDAAHGRQIFRLVKVAE